MISDWSWTKSERLRCRLENRLREKGEFIDVQRDSPVVPIFANQWFYDTALCTQLHNTFRGASGELLVYVPLAG